MDPLTEHAEANDVDQHVQQEQDTPFDEQERLLDDTEDVDHDPMDTPFSPKSLWEDKMFRGMAFAIAISVIYLMIRVVLALLHNAHTGGHSRSPEPIYSNGSDYFASLVILVSLDGFKPAYLDLGLTPHLNEFAANGIQAEAMYPSFPSLTFPNHWTLVTGVYPETHGIVANDFFDPVLGETFRHSSLNSTTNATWWTTVDPIWKTCQQHNRMSATIMWPGSAAIEADFVADFNSTTMPMEKIDMVMELIDLPYLKRPQFYSVYMHHVDTAGHVHGPSKDGVATAVQQVDQAVGYLMEQLKARNLDKHANVVIVSDHGMAKTDKYMYYDDILPGDLIDRLQHREAWPLLDLRPLPDAPANTSLQIFDAFHQFQQLHPDKAHYQVFLKEDIPEKFHYSHHDRIAPVIVLPDPGYAFVSHNLADPTSGVPSQPAGMHGYDPFDEDMWAIFMAAGPKIDKAYPSSKRLAPFGNVEVYEVLTELMNINANPNNGSFHGYLPTL